MDGHESVGESYLVPRKKSSTLTDNGKVVIMARETASARLTSGSDAVVYSANTLTFYLTIQWTNSVGG